MGREIRRVPPGWQHPMEANRYSMEHKPLYDDDFATVAGTWVRDCIAWENGTHDDLQNRPELKQEYPYFWQWSSSPPDAEYYRPSWTQGEATAYQVYETVSEGTPVSPVFDDLKTLIAWLISQGHSPTAARRFAETGWAPSMIMHRTGDSVQIASGIDTHDLMRDNAE